MTIVSSLHGTRVQEFWKAFLPQGEAQNPILWYRKKAHPESASATWHPASYRDLNAQAHCAAAFFMARGLRKGDRVGIVSRQGLDYLVLDLALQFIGAVNLSLPWDCSLENVVEACDEHLFRFIYYSDIHAFQAHGQLEVLKPRLTSVLVSGEDVDGLDPEKVVTFDRVVGLGKIDWREEAQQLVDLKSAVAPTDVYSIEYNPEKGRFDREVSFSEMMDQVAAAEDLYKEHQVKLLLSALTPDHLHQRLRGIFPALRLRTQVYIIPAEKLSRDDFAGLNPQALLTDPEGMAGLFGSLPEYLGGGPKVEKTFSKAFAVVARREEALAMGKKNPLTNRLRYSSVNKKLYRKVQAQLGGKLRVIFCDAGLLEVDASQFFTECDIRIEQ